MDRAGDIRRICSRLLFAALTIQALTPDALDLTLLANHRLPGPILAAMSMLAVEREVEGGLRFTADAEAAIRPSSSSSFPEEDPSAPPADNVMQPLWPELGLARSLSRCGSPLPPFGSSWHALVVDPSPDRHGDTPASGPAPAPDSYRLTCRMTC